MNQAISRTREETMMEEIKNTQKMCQMLMATSHYQKLGSEGIFAIVEKAKSIGVSPLEALNGGMYFVQGKVELTAGMMNQLIRQRGHSITKDKKSDDTICILHGKRADNGDTWVESFSIEDAKKAGIYRNQWIKYPKDMLFARALSRLARQLFPDVIKGCYVQGEITDTKNVMLQESKTSENMEEMLGVETITEEEARSLEDLIIDDEEYSKCVYNFLEKQLNIERLEDMPKSVYDKVYPVAHKKYEERNALFEKERNEEEQNEEGEEE